jgi:hypothetical protein
VVTEVTGVTAVTNVPEVPEVPEVTAVTNGNPFRGKSVGVTKGNPRGKIPVGKSLEGL